MSGGLVGREGGKVDTGRMSSEFQSFRVSEFQSFRVSEFQSFRVSEFQSFRAHMGQREGRCGEKSDYEFYERGRRRLTCVMLRSGRGMGVPMGRHGTVPMVSTQSAETGQ